MVTINTSTIGSFRRNLCFKSEDETDATKWTLNALSVTPADTGTLDPYGTQRASYHEASGSGTAAEILTMKSPVNGQDYVYSVFVKPDTTTQSRVRIYHGGTGSVSTVLIVNWSGGVPTIGGGSGGVGGGNHDWWVRPWDGVWWRLVVLCTYDSSTGGGGENLVFESRIDNTGTTGKGWFAFHQMEEASLESAYQPQLGSADQWTGDYSTVQAWLAGTGGDLVTDDRREIGELLPGLHSVAAGAILAAEASGNTSNTQYRQLTAASANRHLPEAGGPVTLEVQFASAGDEAGIKVREDYFRISNIGIVGTFASTWIGGDKSVIHCEYGTGQLIYQTFILGREGQYDTGLSMAGIQMGTTTGPTNYCVDFVLREVIVQGSPFARGIGTGFLINNFTTRGEVYNCAAYQISGGAATPRGFWSLPTRKGSPLGSDNLRFYNNVALGCERNGTGSCMTLVALKSDATTVPSEKEFGNCIVSDFSLYATNVAGSGFTEYTANTTIHNSVQGIMPDAQWGVSPTAVFSNPRFRDFHSLPQSPGLDAGYDLTTEFEDATKGPGDSDDFEGSPRAGAGWDIGPYVDWQQPNTLPATERVFPVGSLSQTTLRAFSTIDQFLGAVPSSPFNANERWVAELYADTDFDYPVTPLVVDFKVTSPKRCIIIRGAARNRFNPLGAGRGARITGGSSGSFDAVVDLRADNVKLEGLGVVSESTDSVVQGCVRILGCECIVDALYLEKTAGTSTKNVGLEVQGAAAIARNCIARGVGTGSGTGLTHGFLALNCDRPYILNCVAWYVQGNAATNYGVFIEDTVTRPLIANTIAYDSDTDFDADAGIELADFMLNCDSGDSSAVGPGARTSIDETAYFVLSVANDFRPKPESPALYSGASTLLFNPKDWLEVLRSSPPSRGVYETVVEFPLFMPDWTGPTMGQVACVEIRRLDGVVVRVCGNSEAVQFQGHTYEPHGSVNLSARSSEAGSKPTTSQIDGALTSDKITVEDMVAGLYKGAKLTVFWVDPEATFAAPRRTDVYFIGGWSHGQLGYTAELSGIMKRLERRIGDKVQLECGLDLGGPRCGVNLTGHIQPDVRVATVVSQRVVTLNSSDVDASKVDDFFGNGYAEWITGDNAGQLQWRIKGYTQATRTLEFVRPLPKTIQVNDRMRIVPGCRHRWVDCDGKWGNSLRYGGRETMPGGDRALQATR